MIASRHHYCRAMLSFLRGRGTKARGQCARRSGSLEPFQELVAAEPRTKASWKE